MKGSILKRKEPFIIYNNLKSKDFNRTVVALYSLKCSRCTLNISALREYTEGYKVEVSLKLQVCFSHSF